MAALTRPATTLLETFPQNVAPAWSPDGQHIVFVSNRLVVNLSTSTLEAIRNEMFASMEKLPLKYFDAHTHGELMSLFTNDTDTLRDMMR